MPRQEHKELELSKRNEVLRKPLSVGFFDIDGTLTEGFTIFSFAEFLTNRGFFREEFYKQMQDGLEDYRVSDKGEEAYRRLANNWVDNSARGLQGQRTEKIFEQGKVFLQETLKERTKGYKILDFSKALVREVGKFCRTIAISGSPLEPLNPLTKYLGFDELRATMFKVLDGVYTGNTDLNLALGVSKRKVIDGFLREGVDKKRSFAFGDSPHDLAILEAVDNAFVLGANPVLQQIAKEKDWIIVTQEDDIVRLIEQRIDSVFY